MNDDWNYRNYLFNTILVALALITIMFWLFDLSKDVIALRHRVEALELEQSK
jgi:hypothetical protein